MKVGHRRRRERVPAHLLDDPEVTELQRWGSRLAQAGLSPGESGNLSRPANGGFLITRTGVALATIDRDDWVLVTGIDHDRDGRVVVASQGMYEPSRDAAAHAAVYRHRPQMKAVFHLHVGNLDELSELGVPSTTAYYPAGTQESMDEIDRFLAGHPDARFFILIDHGIVAMGDSAGEVGALVEHYQHRRAEGG